jgi:hypothetical protein
MIDMNFLLSLKSFPELLFLAVFLTALLILAYVLGKEMIIDKMNKNTLTSVSQITSKQVAQYFIDNGYVVCNISPGKNENKWFGYLIKNGEYLIATAFTNGQWVERHIDSLEQ